jgi:nucleoside-diphosphate-sugar epimerase
MAATSRSVLVTGASGFIGRYVCRELLAHGVAVRGLVRDTCAAEGVERAAIADLQDAKGLARAVKGVDTVVHLAARVHVMEPPGDASLAAFRHTNVAGTQALLDAALAAGVERFLFVSSVKAVCERSSEPLTEETVPAPLDPYGLSKLEAECVVREYATDGLSAAIIRLPVVYGPGVKGNVLRIFDLIDWGIPLPVAADNSRSMIYVGNVVAAIDAVLSSPSAAGETFFASDAEHLSTADLARRIALALDRREHIVPLPTSVLSRVAELVNLTGRVVPLSSICGALRRVTESLVVSTEKIARLAAYVPPFSVDEGLRHTAAWYRSRERTVP